MDDTFIWNKVRKKQKTKILSKRSLLAGGFLLYFLSRLRKKFFFFFFDEIPVCGSVTLRNEPLAFFLPLPLFQRYLYSRAFELLLYIFMYKLFSYVCACVLWFGECELLVFPLLTHFHAKVYWFVKSMPGFSPHFCIYIYSCFL